MAVSSLRIRERFYWRHVSSHRIWNLTYSIYTKYKKTIKIIKQPALVTTEVMDTNMTTQGNPEESEEGSSIQTGGVNVWIQNIVWKMVRKLCDTCKRLGLSVPQSACCLTINHQGELSRATPRWLLNWAASYLEMAGCSALKTKESSTGKS